MAVVALDTDAAVKDLQAAGFTEAQAEALTRAVHRNAAPDLSSFATKADLSREIDGLRKELKGDIEGLRKELKGDIDGLRKDNRADLSDLKADMLKWVIGAVGLQTVVVVGALITLVRLMPR